MQKNQRLLLNSRFHNRNSSPQAATGILYSQTSRSQPQELTQMPEIPTSKRLLFLSMQLLSANISNKCNTRFHKVSRLQIKLVCLRFSNSPPLRLTKWSTKKLKTMRQGSIRCNLAQESRFLIMNRLGAQTREMESSEDMQLTPTRDLYEITMKIEFP